MTTTDGKVEQLLAKHPSLTKQEALRIVTEKNERKRQKRAGKTEKIEKIVARQREYEANKPEPNKASGEANKWG